MTAFLYDVGQMLRAGKLTAREDGDFVAPQQRVDAVFAEDLDVVHVTPGFVESRHVVGLYVDAHAKVRAVAKTPRREWDSGGVRRESAALTSLAHLAPQLADTIPEVLACLIVQGRVVLVQTALDGAPLTHRWVRRDPEAAAAVGRWIQSLPITGQDDGGVVLDELLEPLLVRLENMLPRDHELRSLTAATRLIVDRLRGVRLSRPFEHGDPSHPNLLVAGKGASARVGLVDWELACEKGAPGHDLAQFLAFTAFARAGAHGHAAEGTAFQAEFAAPEAPGRQRFAAAVSAELPADLIDPLFVLAWARSALRLLDRLAPSAHLRPAEGHVVADTPTDAQLLDLLSRSRNAALWKLSVFT